MREDPVCAREAPAIVATMASARECVFVVIFGSLLFCTREHCVDLRVVFLERIGRYVRKHKQFFFKLVPDIGHLYMGKNRMRCPTIVRSYCRYDYHVTIVVNDSSYLIWYNDVVIPCRVATVVTTVVMR